MAEKATNKEQKSKKPLILRGFTYIAIWQSAAFLILFLLIWVNEVVDIAALVYKAPPSPPDLTRACVSSAGVLLAAIVAIGHTYVQQQNLIFGILTICSYCHKVRISSADWERVEEYVEKRTAANFSHGICPDCIDKAKEDMMAELSDITAQP